MTIKALKLLLIVATIAMGGLITLSVSAAPPAQQGDAQRGAYLFALNGGCGCHMG